MVKQFVTGLVVGKFCPFHNGHRKVLEAAAAQCECVIVLSYTSANFQHCSTVKREEWLKQAVKELNYNSAEVTVRVLDSYAAYHGITDESSEFDHRQFCAKYLLNDLGTTVDAVFSSEDYGQGFADHLSLYFTTNLLNPVNVQSLIVDKERTEFPVSCTALIAASGRIDRRGRGKLRRDGGGSGARVSRERQHCERRQFSQRRDAARITVPRGHCQCQRAEHARADLHRHGPRRTQYPQHGQQITRRNGVYAGRCRQSCRRRRHSSPCGYRGRAVGASDTVSLRRMIVRA